MSTISKATMLYILENSKDLSLIKESLEKYEGTFETNELHFLQKTDIGFNIIEVIKKINNFSLLDADTLLENSYFYFNFTGDILDCCIEDESSIFAYHVSNLSDKLIKNYFKNNKDKITISPETFIYLVRNTCYDTGEFCEYYKNTPTLNYNCLIGINVECLSHIDKKIKIPKSKYDNFVKNESVYIKWLEVVDTAEDEECKICSLKFEENCEKIYSVNCIHALHKDCYNNCLKDEEDEDEDDCDYEIVYHKNHIRNIKTCYNNYSNRPNCPCGKVFKGYDAEDKNKDECYNVRYIKDDSGEPYEVRTYSKNGRKYLDFNYGRWGNSVHDMGLKP